MKVETRKFFAIRLVSAAVLVAWTMCASLAHVGRSIAAESEPVALRQDVRIRKKVTVIADAVPISDVLLSISEQSHTAITATKSIGDQRITLRVVDEPLYQVMIRLVDTLSHLNSSPKGYSWRKIDSQYESTAAYQLWRSPSSLREERAALEFPRRRAGEVLRIFRNLADPLAGNSIEHNPDDREYIDFKSAPDFHEFRQAFQGLTNAQLARLMSSGVLPLNIEVFNKQPGALVGSDVNPPGSPMLVVEPDNRNGERPERSHIFKISLRGVNLSSLPADYNGTMSILLDPVRERSTPFEDNASPGPIIDLSSVLGRKEVTPEQRADIGFTLQALAKVAKINVYYEFFFKKNLVGPKYRGLRFYKGTLSQIVKEVCDVWDCKAARVDGDYLFWSRTWAQDRYVDIPDQALASWRQRLAKQGKFSIDDRAKMAIQFSWPQVTLTLNELLPESGPWNRLQEYRNLRFYGHLSPAERAATTRKDGLPFVSLAQSKQKTLVDDLLSGSNRLPGLLQEEAAGLLRQLHAARLVYLRNGNNGNDAFGVVMPTGEQLLSINLGF